MNQTKLPLGEEWWGGGGGGYPSHSGENTINYSKYEIQFNQMEQSEDNSYQEQHKLLSYDPTMEYDGQSFHDYKSESQSAEFLPKWYSPITPSTWILT